LDAVFTRKLYNINGCPVQKYEDVINIAANSEGHDALISWTGEEDTAVSVVYGPYGVLPALANVIAILIDACSIVKHMATNVAAQMPAP
jgi:hypothetical protein